MHTIIKCPRVTRLERLDPAETLSELIHRITSTKRVPQPDQNLAQDLYNIHQEKVTNASASLALEPRLKSPAVRDADWSPN